MSHLVARLRLVPRTVTTAGKNGIHCAVGEWCHEAALRITLLEIALREIARKGTATGYGKAALVHIAREALTVLSDSPEPPK